MAQPKSGKSGLTSVRIAGKTIVEKFDALVSRDITSATLDAVRLGCANDVYCSWSRWRGRWA